MIFWLILTGCAVLYLGLLRKFWSWDYIVGFVVGCIVSCIMILNIFIFWGLDAR